MELTVKIEDKKVYNTLIQFLKSLGIKVVSTASSGQKAIHGGMMANVLEKIALSGGIKSIANPSVWQKQMRKDRKF